MSKALFFRIIDQDIILGRAAAMHHEQAAHHTGEEELERVWPDVQVEWAFYESGEPEPTVHIDSLDEVVNALKEKRPDYYEIEMILLLSGKSVISSSVNIPSKQAKFIEQALPFEMEDMLTSDPDDYHFTRLSKDKEGNLSVVAVLESTMHACIDVFAHAGLALDQVIPDMLALPMEENQWSMLADDSTLYIRTSELEGVTIETTESHLMLNSLLHVEEEMLPEEIALTFVESGEKIQDDIKMGLASATAGQDIEISTREAPTSSFLVFCDYLVSGVNRSPLNLLHDNFRPDVSVPVLNFNWKPVAIMLAVLVILQMGMGYTEAWVYEQKSEKFDQRSSALFKKYFPDSKRIPGMSVQSQTKSKLKAMADQGESGGFLPLLAVVGERFYRLNEEKAKLSILRMSYDKDQANLRLDVTADNFETLETFKGQLKAVPLDVDMGSASKDKDKVKARLTIGGL